MSAVVKTEANRLLNFLASMPQGNCTASSREVVRAVMLQTGGRMMACGSYFDVKAKALGGGVYRLTLERIS
jgi:hypothetical protein